MTADETIVAIASPTSPAVRGVVRLSGTEVHQVLKRLGCNTPPLRPQRQACEIDLAEPLGRLPVDLMFWPTHRSYTGEPAAEIHTVGSLPLLTAIVERATEAGARPARPGEFTMRAFLAGRLDLTQAEAVLGVIEAEGRGSLNHALEQLAGNLSRPLEQLRSTLLDLLADVEAGLDFVDEDIEFIEDRVLIERLDEAKTLLTEIAERMSSRGGSADRPSIAVRGEPNAGKSCLINRLAGREVAIVSDVAGTTRDAVTTAADIAGIAVTLVDTAGVEEISSDITRQSQQQAHRAIKQARLRLWCVDASQDDFDEAMSRLSADARRHRRSAVTDLFVITKSDLADRMTTETNWIACSAATGEGINRLIDRLVTELAQRDQQETGSVIGTAARCHTSIRSAREAIARAIELTRHQQGHEFVASELRDAAGHVGEVTGAVYTDDILDRVFGRFCIGK